jgi:phosphocarrier protein HPr
LSSYKQDCFGAKKKIDFNRQEMIAKEMQEAGESILENTVCETEVQIKNADGLHMRPAMKFVDIANRFESEITVSNDKTSVSGKSIMQISMLAATCGTRLKVKAEGPDAPQALEALRELVEVKMFDEPAGDNEKS